MLKNLVNAALFQLGWFTCVLGGNSGWLLITLLILIVHLRLIGSWRSEGKLLLTVFALGCVLDSALIKLGVFDFGEAGKVIPLWLALMWPLLATTLGHCLAWSATPWWLASLLGAIGGPASYIAGAQLTYVQLPLGVWPSVLIIGAVWAVIFPLLHRLARYFRQTRTDEVSA
ncbi:Protein of unknown function [Pseudomonas sp. NFACC02]|uniref:DUF2878 domain-containing protein n=1 Tax=Pseudomonas sp. NFACC02 TaxID=1566250 RepID=UPI0008B22FBC|nr:DUF2878 domain-containing protein [Pseudomonas sp. NFACC02]SEQ49741.1 Protein of unknown function [Pseudomonas sp. NFACC02]